MGAAGRTGVATAALWAALSGAAMASTPATVITDPTGDANGLATLGVEQATGPASDGSRDLTAVKLSTEGDALQVVFEQAAAPDLDKGISKATASPSGAARIRARRRSTTRSTRSLKAPTRMSTGPRAAPTTRSVPTAAEEQQEELEDVEHVEEDARRDRHGGLHPRATQTLEVEGRQPSEDHQAEDGVDHVLGRDRHEDRDDPEGDQPEQCEEEVAGVGRQVAPRRVAPRAERPDEERGAPRGLPDDGRVLVHVDGDRRPEREAEQEPEGEQQRDGQALAALRCDVQAEQAHEARDEAGDAPSAAEVAADVGAGGGEADGDPDQPHDLAEHGARVDGAGGGVGATWGGQLVVGHA